MTAQTAIFRTLSTLADGLTLAALTDLICEMFPALDRGDVIAAALGMGLIEDSRGCLHVERRTNDGF